MKIYNGLTPLQPFGEWRIVREVSAEYANERLGKTASKIRNKGYVILDSDEVLYVMRGSLDDCSIGRWYVIENKPMAHCNKS